MTDDLVERLRKGVPYWTPPGAYMDRPNVSAGDAVMREAADAILKLQGEVAEWLSVAESTGQDFRTTKLVVTDLRTRLEAAEAEVARMREALAATKVKPLDMWEAMDGARKPGEPTT